MYSFSTDALWYGDDSGYGWLVVSPKPACTASFIGFPVERGAQRLPELDVRHRAVEAQVHVVVRVARHAAGAELLGFPPSCLMVTASVVVKSIAPERSAVMPAGPRSTFTMSRPPSRISFGVVVLRVLRHLDDLLRE